MKKSKAKRAPRRSSSVSRLLVVIAIFMACGAVYLVALWLFSDYSF